MSDEYEIKVDMDFKSLLESYKESCLACSEFLKGFNLSDNVYAQLLKSNLGLIKLHYNEMMMNSVYKGVARNYLNEDAMEYLEGVLDREDNDFGKFSEYMERIEERIFPPKYVA